MDNASIHIAGATQLLPLLTALNIRIRFMPPYSPELNPCELVFAQIKRYIRNHRRPVTIEDELVEACARVTVAQVTRYYHHCIDHIILGGT
jgi:transposase